MGRVNTPKLDASSFEELEKLYKTSQNHSLRKRCQTILLKGQGRSSKDVGEIVGMSHVSVNSWLKRYKREGISGLHIKKGRGRKPLIDLQLEDALVLESIKKHRQRVSRAKSAWEEATDKAVSKSTFKRFLKSLVEDINV
jgi:transposase